MDIIIVVSLLHDVCVCVCENKQQKKCVQVELHNTLTMTFLTQENSKVMFLLQLSNQQFRVLATFLMM